jgi:RNA polymerase sigma-70 factor (ECF subfamily)
VGDKVVDPGLIERARSGDDTAFSEIVSSCRNRVLGTIARLISRPEDVEDVGQQVFLRLYQSLGQLRTPAVFESWLYRLTVNAAYDYLRRRRKQMETRVADLSEQQILAANAAEAVRRTGDAKARADIRELVQSLLASVSEEDRILLLLKEVDGLSLKELETIYHVNENALKVRLFRARQRALRALAKVKERAGSAAKG